MQTCARQTVVIISKSHYPHLLDSIVNHRLSSRCGNVRRKVQPGHKCHSSHYHSLCQSIMLYEDKNYVKGTAPQKSMWALNVHFPRRQQCYHIYGCETHANRAITAQRWDYLVYLRDLAVHKDHLPHHRMTSQSAKQLCNYDVI